MCIRDSSVVASGGATLACLSAFSCPATWNQKPGTSWPSRRTTWKLPLSAQSGVSCGTPPTRSCPTTNSPGGISRVP